LPEHTTSVSRGTSDSKNALEIDRLSFIHGEMGKEVWVELFHMAYLSRNNIDEINI
jgi:hypothetical protein